jgi:hypothetical protein
VDLRRNAVLNFKKMIFIVACTNSGTKCLLHSLLEHPELGGFRMEIHWFGLAPNIPGRMDRLFALWPCFPTNYLGEEPPHHHGGGPWDRTSTECILNQAWRLLGEKQKKAGKRLLLKDPKFCLRLKWIRKLWPDCKIVLLVRNPWSVSEGIRRKLPLVGDVPSGIDIPTACAQWINANTVAMLDSRDMKNVLRVRYEDMIRANKFPYGENGDFWKRLLDFCELEQDGFSIPNKSEYSKFTHERDGASLANMSTWEKGFVKEAARGLIEDFGYSRYLEGKV